jgi:hypothetical protein
MILRGTVYAPRASLNATFNGSLAAPGYAAGINEYIVYDLNVSGNGAVQADASFNQPPSVTLRLAPDPKVLPGGSLVTNAPQSILQGTTKRGATVDLGTGNDGRFDDAETTADASGHFSFPVTLTEGANLLQVRATSRFDLQASASLPVFLDTVPPVVAIATPSPGLLTADNVVVGGQVTDNFSGVASLQAQIDSGPYFSVDFGPTGGYAFETTLATDGSMDGVHTVNLRATDRAGNTSGLFSTNFDLESKPHITILGPVAGIATHTNLTITGHVSAGQAGITSVTEALDGGDTMPLAFDSNGNFSFLTSLLLDGSNDGSHTVEFLATDGAGRTSDPVAFPFTLDTRPPVVTITAPIGIVNTNTNLTISGQATDLLSGVASLQATVGSGPFAPVSLDSSGHFSFITALALDGSADGIQNVLFRASDNAGNSFDAPFSFTLLTTPPATPVFQLDPTANSGTPANPVTTAATVTLIGHTSPNVTVTLDGPVFQTVSSNTGTFQFTNIPLDLGDNTFTAQATDVAGTSSFTLTINRQPPTGQQNAVLVWNQAVLNAIQMDASDPLVASRAMAMVQAAVFDAVSAIEGTPGYAIQLTAPAGASATAAVATAAHTVLSYLYPAQQDSFDALLADSLAQVPPGQGQTDGITVGQVAGNAIIALRANDGWNKFVDYVPGSSPGAWVPTAPMYMEALDPQWATMQPWTMASPSPFRPAGPPALNSQAWADAFNETKSLGSATSTTRTADQTQIARFWADGSGSYTPAGHWNQIAAQAAQQAGDSLAEDARLFAELDITLADAAIVCWDAKYTYNAWRPVTAIRTADTAGNPSVGADPTWTPLVITPPFPEYVSGHSTFSAAAAAVLDSFFGGSFGFSTTSVTLPGVTRSFTGFDQAAAEASRSRIYAGLHFEFSNQDGQTAGRALADYALNFFNIAQDTIPPQVALDRVLPSGASNHNFTLTGQVTDNLSGPASLTLQVDQGNVQNISIDAGGHFAIPTTFPLDGSADGPHTLTLVARDFAGNASTPVAFSFVLSTHAPVIALTSPANGDNLVDGATLAGAVTTSGAAITALSYAFDGGASMPITFDATGAFIAPLDLSKLTAGAHILAVTTQDAAGNSANIDVNLGLPAMVPLTLSSVIPANGTDQVGVAFRPKIVFSRPIDPSSLNSDDFFATDSSGTKLAASIVPAQDDTSAWLFFTNALPGASTITLTVDGSGIKAADGALLDAAGTGTPGSTLTSTFTTVNQATLPGTSLTGILADPGPDLKPNTFADVRPGPDGVLMTADDVYLNPIVGAKVYILGLENQVVYTDSQGRFTFSSVPSGDIKLDIDGRTANNAPAGMYFPDMVMDLTIKPGQVNTVMGSMGTREETTALGNTLGVYLPRLQDAILQPVSNDQPTMIEVQAEAAPDLTAAQRQDLTLEVQPNSAIGADGQPMNNVQVGVSTVPTVLIKDMLPAGVQDPRITITVQAPGVATFSTPIAVTYPNVNNDPPGTKLNFISFDHTTGRLEIEGTATVSADGLFVVTDPGVGITHPGWHFVAAGSLDADQIGADSTKGDYADPLKLVTEYPECLVDPVGCIAAAKTIVLAADAYFSLSGQSTAAQLLSHFLANSGTSVDFPAGSGPSAKLRADQAFQDADNDVQQRLKNAILEAIATGDENVDLNLDLELSANPDAFTPVDTDLHNAFGHMQGVNVSAEGDINGDIVTGELHYQYTITYGFGTNDANRPGITSAVMRQARLLQLAGVAEPFTATIEVTVPIDIDLGEDPSEIMATPTMSTVPGFGNDPSIYYRLELANCFTVAGRTDAHGHLNNIVLTPNTAYRGLFYSASTNRWTTISARTGPSGQVFGVEGSPSTIYLDHFGDIDTTGDGLPDIGRYVIGLRPGVRSYAGDGIDDAAKLAAGLDPLAGEAFPTGVVATLPMSGSVEKLAVDGSTILRGWQRRTHRGGRLAVQ